MAKEIKFYEKKFYAAQASINQISDSFCAAKWLQVSLHLTNGKTHSCYHPPTHDIDKQDLLLDPSSLHNTKQKFIERKMMLEGQRPPGCEYCWKIEDSGHISDRYYRSSEHWAIDEINHIKDLPHDFPINPTYVEVNFNQTCNFKCSYCSPHLSSKWQDEIETFGPYKINDTLHNHIGTLKNAGLMPVEGSTKDNPYLESFWKWWPDLYQNLKVFRMTGGEPLMDANTFKVLDYIIAHPNKNLELSVTSNLCPPKELFEKFLSKIKSLDNVTHQVECYVPDTKNGRPWQEWPHYIIGAKNKEYHNSELPSIERENIPETFEGIGHAKENGSFTYLYSYDDYACKHFTLYVSLDSVGSQAEYIRNGLDFKILEENLERFLSETENTSVSFINTFNRLSIPSLQKYLEMILRLRESFSGAAQRMKGTKRFQRIWFDIPLLRRPEWLSVLNCDDKEIQKLKDILNWMYEYESERYNQNLQGFRPHEIEKLQRNIDVIENNRFNEIDIIKNNKNFKEFFLEHDKRRLTSFENAFPDLAEWYRNL